MAQPLDRLADAVEDFLSITLATQESLVVARTLDEDPDVARILSPIIDTMERVRARREKRLEEELAEPEVSGQPGLLLLDAPPELAPHVSDVLLGGAGRIAVERARQKLAVEVGGEGYDADHDAEEGENLAVAGAQYALPKNLRTIVRGGAPLLWPWQPGYWKPTPGDRIRELEKAGALIAAAIDSLLAEGKVRNDQDA